MNRPGIPIQGAPTSGPIWLHAPLSVGIQDIEGLTLTATTGLRVSGRLDFEGDLSRPRTSASRVQIAIEPADTTDPWHCDLLRMARREWRVHVAADSPRPVLRAGAELSGGMDVQVGHH